MFTLSVLVIRAQYVAGHTVHLLMFIDRHLLVTVLSLLCLFAQGWQHVGDRLISATVEYEETGWYDGQVRLGQR
jgi:hypothetical protein